MRAVLGIDAAWSLTHDSGVALVAEDGAGAWRCCGLAPSYAEFLALAGMPMPTSFDEVPSALVEATCRLSNGATLEVVAADIPLARGPITARRVADNLVSKKYGGRGCSTHSPSAIRPGAISDQLRDGFAACGYHLATTSLAGRSILECYPHPTLLRLMEANYRLPYKVSAWKGKPADVKWVGILEQLQLITEKLSRHIVGIKLEWPTQRAPLCRLKGIEDQIDALVCAWLGIVVLEGRAEPLGDDEAAIWLPLEDENPSMNGALSGG